MTRAVSIRVPGLERPGHRHLQLVPSPTDTELTAAAQRPAPSSLTAAALNVDVAAPPTQALWGAQAWQSEAWDHYDSCPELHRATTDMAEAFSRAVMIVVDIDPQTGELGADPTNNPTAGAVGAAMFGGRVGQAQAQRAAAQHLTVPGEYYVLASDGVDVDDEAWQTLSAAEVSKVGSFVQVTRMDGTRRTLQAGEILFRVWQPHPRWRWQADSPTRAALDPLREIAGLSAQIMASIRSRLATAGVWLLPQSAQLPADRDEQGVEIPGSGGGADVWLRKMATSMIAAIQDPESPAALAPIIAMVPDDVLDKIKDPFQFVRDVITEAQTLRDAAVRRLAIGMDMPPERLTGMSASNHWCKPVTSHALTRSGWVSGKDVEVGDEILTLDHATGSASWQPVRDVYRAHVDDEAMLTLSVSAARGPSYDLTATVGHRYPVMRNGQRLITTTPRPGDVLTRGAQAPAPAQATYNDDMVRLVAWHSADGTLTTQNGKPGQLRIGKSWRVNPEATGKLIDALTGAFGPARKVMPRTSRNVPMWRAEYQDRGMMLAVLNAAARDQMLAIVPDKSKVIPREFVDKLTAAQRDIFLEAWFDSDGHSRTLHDATTGEIKQREADRLDAVEYAAILAGHGVRRWVTQSHGFTSGPMHNLRISCQPTVTVRAVTETSYSGGIWCPVTATGTWLSQDPDGWSDYTGNSAWLSDETFVKGPLSSLLSVPADAYTRFYLRPMLRHMGLDPSLFAFAFDVSAMLPDVEVQNAITAYQSGALSERQFLTVLGFDPDRDASTNVERARRLVLDILGRGNPDTLEELLPMLQQLFPGFDLTVPVSPSTGPQPPAGLAPDPATVAAPKPAVAPSTTDTQSPPPRPAGPPDHTPPVAP